MCPPLSSRTAHAVFHALAGYVHSIRQKHPMRCVLMQVTLLRLQRTVLHLLPTHQRRQKTVQHLLSTLQLRLSIVLRLLHTQVMQGMMHSHHQQMAMPTAPIAQGEPPEACMCMLRLLVLCTACRCSRCVVHLQSRFSLDIRTSRHDCL